MSITPPAAPAWQGALGREEVSALVARLGYTPRPMDTLAQRRLLVEREKAQLALAKRRLQLAAVLAVPVAVLGMADASLARCCA